MPELVHLQFGAKPWEPSETSRVIAVYDKHDRPTCGLIEQQGHTFLFDCIEGHAWDVNVWAYVEVTEDQIADGSRRRQIRHNSRPGPQGRAAGSGPRRG
ncbi:hypothetical protein ABZ897_08880 [Nonomuraea sp. NPDC046802]|uniref:hypothetical protein n=1 Tax=Nonomuraea sp. NPDC046802 TaxID=3154919 RepID=UPI0033C5EFB5